MAYSTLSCPVRFPGLKKIGVTAHEFSYSHKAFPRCSILLEYFKRSNPLAALYLKVNVFCSTDCKVNKHDFMVEQNNETEKDRYFLRKHWVSSVDVCLLQCDKTHSLTTQDKVLLDFFKRRYSPEHAEKVVFVIDEKIDESQFCSVSEAISGILEWETDFNDVLKRLFQRQSDELAVRISLLLEQQLIAEIGTIATVEFEKGNETELLYHQLKCVSIRNKMIREFGHENDKLFVSILDISNEKEVKEYLEKVIQKADDIEINQFKKRSVKKLSLKSGDKVANTTNDIYGTVGLSLRDITHHYGVTCKHVIEDCLKFEVTDGIPTPEYDVNDIFIQTDVGNVGTDKIYTPSDDLDFSAVRLVGNNIPISSRLRQRDGGLVNGRLFGRDMLLLPPNTLVYKWGAASGLTTGRYIGRREQTDQQHPLFTIQNEPPEVFAIGGDSGSLVCYSRNGLEIAAVILKGRLEEDDDLFVGYKLKDALDSCTTISADIRECIHQP